MLGSKLTIFRWIRVETNEKSLYNIAVVKKRKQKEVEKMDRLVGKVNQISPFCFQPNFTTKLYHKSEVSTSKAN